jgi:hypothetical protein
MAYRTLGALRGELLARLGMGAMGASGGANQSLIDSFLRNGQSQLYWETEWNNLTTYEDKTIGYGQNSVDYPDACARNQRILRLETVYNGQWRQIPEGIVTEMWSTMETLSYPKRYERLEQCLIYPKADQVYTIRFWFIKDLSPFVGNDDPATLDDELILLHAVANAKAHYRQPDAQVYQGQLNSLLGHIRGLSFGSSGTYRRTKPGEADPKPLVIGRDVP